MHNQWSDSFLDRMRHETDPLAGLAISIIFDEGGVPKVNELWDDFLRNDQMPPGEEKSAINSYLKSSELLPGPTGG